MAYFTEKTKIEAKKRVKSFNRQNPDKALDTRTIVPVGKKDKYGYRTYRVKRK